MSNYISIEEFESSIRQRDFSKLFKQLLGWDHIDAGERLRLQLTDDENIEITRIAQKRGFTVCQYDAGKNYPKTKIERRRLLNKLARHHYEHLLIICAENKQCWMVTIRPQNRPPRTIEIEWRDNQNIRLITEKLDGLIFSMADEDGISITDVVEKVKYAFMENSEGITRKFYKKFREELKAFNEFVEGIQSSVSKEQYAALMLNRLMFIYFLQKKNFLDGDRDYLKNRLNDTKQKYGKDTFHNRFYRHFLRRLFTEGLDTPKTERSAELNELLGDVPYLNGGLFDVHAIERENEHIEIKDEAFENIFSFFGKYNWHLDTRVTPSGTSEDINPDVIGYIFEKYINDRAAMGAYYTQEDITGYIARNTIIPFLLHRAKEKCANAFDREKGIWRLLREQPERYIYDAAKKGCNIPDEEIPENIRCGISTETPNLIERRKRWNTEAEEKFSLSSETWRETIARRARYFELVRKMETGEMHEIDDLITYNLDIELFAVDALQQYEGSDFIDSFYEAIAGRDASQFGHSGKRGITVLDPACGSGAFLFAALNVLEPLYKICVDRMRDFITANDQAREKENGKSAGKHQYFRKVLTSIENHPNEKYWIYKTIILNNLYGVDLMPEAAEIAKLRLFLRLAAEAKYQPDRDDLGLEPLPDIDFNIRSGNSLVGFASMTRFSQSVESEQKQGSLDMSDGLIEEIREDARTVEKANNAFKKAQDVGSQDYRSAKGELNKRLSQLNEKMNRCLAGEYGKDNSETDYKKWKNSHRPFHWMAEFYEIIEDNGGFDVVIGNPPYVKIKKIDYHNEKLAEISCPDLYGHIVAHAQQLCSSNGKLGFVVMHNISFNKDYQELRDTITAHGKVWFSFYGRIPDGLFDGGSTGVAVRNCIYILSKSKETGKNFTTRLHRWKTEKRPQLFSLLSYTPFKIKNIIPMFNDEIEASFFQNIDSHPVRKHETKTSSHILYVKQTAYNYISVSLDPPPCFGYDGNATPQTKMMDIAFGDKSTTNMLLLLFAGGMFFTHWLIYGDDFDVTKSNLLSFRLPVEDVSGVDLEMLLKIAGDITHKFEETLQFKRHAGKRVGSYNTARLWNITDQSDLIFLKYMTDQPEQVFESMLLHISQTKNENAN